MNSNRIMPLFFFTLLLFCTAVAVGQNQRLESENRHLETATKTVTTPPSTLSKPSAVVPEFRVNPLNRWLDQGSPAIASDGNGNALIVWRDWRIGRNSSLYGQRIQNGQKTGANFLISSDAPNGTVPTAILNAGGRFAVAWVSSANRVLLCFGDLGTGQLDPVIDIASGVTYSKHNPISLILGNDGTAVLAWVSYDGSTSQYTINTQKYDFNGQAATEIKTLTDPQTHMAWVPALSSGSSSNYVCLWAQQETSGEPTFIYGRPLDEDLNPTGAAQQVAENNSGSINELQATLCGTSHIAVWNSSWTTYAQKFNDNGLRVGGCLTLINFHNFSRMALLTGNRIGLCGYDTYQVYNSELVPQSDAITLDKIHYCTAEFPNNQAMVIKTYTPEGRDDRDIQASMIDLSSGQVQPYADITDDHQGADIEQSWITADASGNFTVFWEIWHNHFYANGYDAGGQLTQADIQLYDHAETMDEGYHRHYLRPACNASGQRAMTWASFYDGIYYQKLDPDGTPYGNYQLLNGSNETYDHTLAINDSGAILSIWASATYGDHANLQLVDPDGNQRYADPATTQAGWPLMTSPSHALYLNTGAYALLGSVQNEQSDFILVFQQSLADGSGVQNFIQVSADSLKVYGPRNARLVLMASDSSYWAVFRAKPNGGDDIYVYGQQITKDGTLSGNNTRLMPEKIAGTYAFDADSQGNGVIAWEESSANWRGDGENIYAQRLVLGQGPVDDPFILHANRNANHWEPKVAVKNGKIYATWIDNRLPESGMSAYAAVLEWASPTGVADMAQPQDFVLAPAYPNPFNPQTTLSLTLSKTAQVQMEVFDIRGRRVATLLDGPKPAGKHFVQWTAGDLPSGVYFIKARCGEHTQVQKIILQK